jgi:DNA-binding XRE family transcriptional regulator
MIDNGTLSATEAINVRTALKHLHGKIGTWETLAKALRVKNTTASAVASGHKIASPTLTFKIARFAKVGVDDVLQGRWPGSCCKNCGARLDEPDATVRDATGSSG